jgi:cell division transport system permease protein
MSGTMASRRAAASARNRLLPEGRVGGPMPWVIAIMMFLTLLAAVAGIGLGNGLWRLRSELAGRYTIQLVEAEKARRERLIATLAASLRRLPAVDTVDIVSQSKLADQLRPWLGDAIDGSDIPIPALIDVSLRPGADAQVVDTVRRSMRAVAPGARLEAHASYLAPVERLMTSLMVLAILLVLLMILATGAVVALAARGAHAANRGTIDILHLMGATDVQIARLFQRRTALDALFGGAVGTIAAVGALLLLGNRMAATASELASVSALPIWGWFVLPLFPLAGTLLAMLIARRTVRRALERTL